MFGITKTGYNNRTTSQAIADTMRVFMSNNSIIQVAITGNQCCVPQIHLHAWPCAVNRCGKVCVAGTCTILRIGNYIVISKSTTSLVAVLKITRRFIKTIQV